MICYLKLATLFSVLCGITLPLEVLYTMIIVGLGIIVVLAFVLALLVIHSPQSNLLKVWSKEGSLSFPRVRIAFAFTVAV